MSEQKIPIPAMLYNAAVGGHVAGADQIIDDETGLTLDKVTGGALEEKEYTSDSDNGMGRVVLRKNLVNGVNTLVQTMINKSNTIYVIQYDFTLGENITVPDNCVLEFEGGSVTGGTIRTNNNNNISIIGKNTVLTGRIEIVVNNSSNVNISGITLVNYTGGVFIQSSYNTIIDSCRFENSQSIAIRLQRGHGEECKNIKITNCTFKNVSATNAWGGAIYIDGQGKTSPTDTTETLPIEDIIIDGNSFKEIGCAGINFGGARNVIISNNTLQKAIYQHSMLITCSRESSKITISGNFFKGCGFECCVLNYCNDFVITGNYFEEFGAGISIESDAYYGSIVGNTFVGLKDIKQYSNTDYTRAIVSSIGKYITISGNTIKDCTHGVTIINSENLNIVGNSILSSNYGVRCESGANSINLSVKDNRIETLYGGIGISGGPQNSIENNNVITSNGDSYGIRVTSVSANHVVTIKNNVVNSPVGLDFSGLYDDAGKLVIVGNELMCSDTPLKKYNFQRTPCTIYWDNPLVELSPINVLQNYDINSVVHFDHDDFNTTDGLPSGTPSLAYYLGGTKGVTYIMSNRRVVQIVSGGGSTQVVTRELVPALPQS